jgi:very-short-patch-repair endonuclease
MDKKIETIKKEYLEGFSIKDISLRYHISRCTIHKILRKENIVRSRKEAAKISKKERTPISEETRKKISKSAKKRMKKEGLNSVWRKKCISYPEKVFIDLLDKNNISKDFLIIKERPFYPYFIDFAFEDLKIAVEIDGSQHEKKENRKRDQKKDKKLIKNGWNVYRIPAKNIIKNTNETFESFLKYIFSSDKKTFVRQEKYEGLKTWKEIKKEKAEIKKKEKELKQKEIINEKISFIINSGIDFSKFGWVNSVSDILKIKPQKVKGWMEKNMAEFYKSCYKRKPRKIDI